jgi:hypothetical protein
MNKLNCNSCNYNTDRLFNYNKHLLSKKHIKFEQLYKKSTFTKIDENEGFDDNGDDNEGFDDNDDFNDVNDGFTNDVICIVDTSHLLCKFCTKKIRKSNMTRHYKTCKYKKVNIYDGIKLNHNQTSCIHCSKPISINNKARHQNNCKHKKNNLITLPNDTSNILTTENDELKKINNDLMDCMKLLVKNIGNNNNNHNSNNTCNIIHVMNNCPDALDFNKLMDAPITSGELQDLNENSALVGSINFLLKRCVTDIDPKDRPFHLADESRGKYCVKLGNDWTIDSKGDLIINKLCEILKSVYLAIDKNDSPEMRMIKNNKYLDLYNNKHKILNYIKDQILLKNNSKLMLE